MLADRYGLPLSTTSDEARDAYVAAVDCLLGATVGDRENLDRALAADPGFALAHVAHARARILHGDVAAARESAARARSLVESASPRERSHVNALCLSVEGKPVEALAATRAHLAEYPRDALVASPAAGVFGLIGFSGRQDREPEQLAFLDALAPHLGDDWWFLAQHAFALEEMGRLDEALAEIERSLAIHPRNAHAAHIKAHVLYEMGEDRAALDYLDAWLPDYPRDGLMHCHISWHVALSALSLGEAERAWRTYEDQVRPGGAWGPPLNVATDAASFLWRAELAGAPRDAKRWADVRDYVSRSFPATGVAFVDVHRALADAACAEPGRLTVELAERARTGRAPAGEAPAAIAAGLDAYAAGDWAGACAALQTALAQTVRIGGSRAQRDLVLNTLLAALIKQGRVQEARRIASTQEDRRPSHAVAGLA